IFTEEERELGHPTDLRPPPATSDELIPIVAEPMESTPDSAEMLDLDGADASTLLSSEPGAAPEVEEEVSAPPPQRSQLPTHPEVPSARTSELPPNKPGIAPLPAAVAITPLPPAPDLEADATPAAGPTASEPDSEEVRFDEDAPVTLPRPPMTDVMGDSDE